MGLFKSQAERELDAIILKLQSNISNNYKDAAQENFKAFEEKFTELQASGGLKPKRVAYYQQILFFASKKSLLLQGRFPKVAEGNSSLLHLPSRYPVRVPKSVVADIEYC